MARIRADYVFGTTTAALAAGDTALSSAELSRLPAISAPDIAAITIHDSATGVYEIVHVTAHAAAAITATITRGQEGSTAQAWASGADWLHGPTATDTVTAESTISRIDGPMTQAAYDALTPAADTLYVIVG